MNDGKSYATRGKILNWFLHFAESRYSRWWLAFFSFIEASVFPIAPDPLLIAILLVDARRWIFDALITTLSSLIGGIIGYIIGAFFWNLIGEAIIDTLKLQDEIIRVQQLFERNAFWSIFLAAFTPIPYKIFTISAGFFHINFLVFFVASLLGRGTRFFVVAYLMRYFGSKISPFVFKYFNIFSLLFAVYVVLIVLSITLF